METKKPIVNYPLMVLSCLGFLFYTGCKDTVESNALEMMIPESPPFYSEMSDSYCHTQLKTSTAADVLSGILLPEYETLSQSKSVVASVGLKKEGQKSWLKMVSFDEDSLTAKRKYFFVEDEKPKILLRQQWEYLQFDCQMVLDPEMLNKPYADENARKVAVLKYVLKTTSDDFGEVRRDNESINKVAMMVNQALQTVVIKLNASPAEAVRFKDPNEGLSFNHISMTSGKIGLIIENDIVTVKMRVGSSENNFKNATCPESCKDKKVN